MNKYPIKFESIRWVKDRHGATLLDPSKGRYYKLNKTASIIWDYSDGTKDENRLAGLIQSEFSIKNFDIVHRDVSNILKDLYQKKLIRYKTQ